jgi:ERCC4-type nuclease
MASEAVVSGGAGAGGPVLVLDNRERGLATELTRLGVPFTTAVLDVGDFTIQSAAGVPLLVAERKSLTDFAASNADGRYREQRARLMAVRGGGTAVVYMLEGTWTGDDSRLVTHGRTTEGQLRRLTSRLVLRYGMPVIATASLTETARWCRTLLAQLADDGAVFQPEEGMATATAAAMSSFTAALSTVKRANKTAGGTAAAMLSAIPGLGAKKCEALVADGRSIADLVGLTADELSALVVGGKRLGVLGPVIYEALHSSGGT